MAVDREDMKRTVGRRLALLSFLSLLLCLPSFALNPASRPSQYGHTSWRLQDGIFKGQLTAIAQTKDGYLWIGTVAGLWRFDGVSFVSWRSLGGPPGALPDVGALYAASDGSLWVGAARSVVRWHNGVATAIKGNFGRPNRFLQAQDGSIWFSQTRAAGAPLCKVEADSAHCFGQKDGITIQTAACAVGDGSGGILLCGTTGLSLWRNGRLTTIPTAIPKAAENLSGIVDAIVDPDGTMWIGSERTGHGLGLQRGSSSDWSPIKYREYDSSKFAVTRIFKEDTGSVWVGTMNAGLYRVSGSSIDHFDSSNGLTGDLVNDIFKDREGNLWVATSKGLDMFRDLKMTTFSKTEGLSSDNVESLAISAANVISAGNGSQVDQISLSEGSIRSLKGLPSGQVTSLLYDHDDHLWVGVDHDLYVMNGLRPEKISAAKGLKGPGIAIRMQEDRSHDLWVLGIQDTGRTLSRINKREIVEQFSSPRLSEVNSNIAVGLHGDLWLAAKAGTLIHFDGKRFTEIAPDRSDDSVKASIRRLIVEDDGMTFGTNNSGLIGWKAGRSRTLSTKNGLPCNRLEDAVQDKDGNLWVYAECGLFELTPAQLRTWWQHQDAFFPITLLDAFDGVFPGYADFSATSALAPDGRLYFANDNDIQSIDPGHIVSNVLPPPVHVEAVLADARSYALGTAANLPANTRNIAITYTALSFIVPQKVRFRYKLEGWDKDWQEADTRRQAFYTNLPPKHYKFHVIACNNDGVWNPVGDAVSFYLRPAFYQTWWFTTIVALVCIAVALLLIALRLRFMTFQIRERWRVRMSERERIARELHDTFLQGVQGVLLRVRTATRKVETGSDARRELEDALLQSNSVLVEGRSLVRDLRSAVQPHSLSAELEAVGRELQNLYPAAFELNVRGSVRELNPHVEEELCKIGREAISNAFHHASASIIKVEIDYGARDLKLSFRDDGVGISREILDKGGRPGHWGLPGIRERVEKLRGILVLESILKGGTMLEVRVGARAAFSGFVLSLPQWFGFSWREDVDG